MHELLRVDDFQAAARRLLPRALYDFASGGAEDEVTLMRNTDDFRRFVLRPRTGRRLDGVSTRTELLGHTITLPVMLAPVGGVRLFHPDGEVAAAAAARDVGTISVLSTMAGHTLEDVAAGGGGPVWYQLYGIGGREAVDRAVDRAATCGCGGLVVTVDTPVVGLRERDVRNRTAVLTSGRPLGAWRQILDVLRHPRWLARFLRDGRRVDHPNVRIGDRALRPRDVQGLIDDGDGTHMTWDDVDRVRARWAGPLVVKGILTAQDARIAADHGADGVIVSNHGGRQLDGVASAVMALPEVAAAAGSMSVLLDGGVRRGRDVVVAICLGADAVLVGRPYVWGAAVAGRDGVRAILDILASEIDRVMRLLGCAAVSDLGPAHLALVSEMESAVAEHLRQSAR